MCFSAHVSHRPLCTTVYNCFSRLRMSGVWDRLVDAVAKIYVGDVQVIDTAAVRMHQQGATARRA